MLMAPSAIPVVVPAPLPMELAGTAETGVEPAGARAPATGAMEATAGQAPMADAMGAEAIPSNI